jgi:hypothetical protein
MIGLRIYRLLPMALVVISGSAFGDTIFTDSTFNLGDYSVAGPLKTDSGSAVTFDQCSACGNPGDGLQIVMTLPDSLDLISLGFVNNNFSYNPQTEGAITSIDASVDKDFIVNMDETGGANTFRPLIEQDGLFYLAAIPGPLVSGMTTGYNTISESGLTASNFLEFDFSTGLFGTTSPDFSGDTMFFGLAQTGQFMDSGIRFEADYDNLQLGIASVPEPSGFGEVGALVFLLGCIQMVRSVRA